MAAMYYTISLLAAVLLTGTGSHALPAFTISKLDRQGQLSHTAHGVLPRDEGSLTTAVFDVPNWQLGGAYYLNSGYPSLSDDWIVS